MSMTVDCRICQLPFGTFRERCPTCGTPAPKCKHGLIPASCAVCNGSVRPVIQIKAKGRRKKDRTDGCVLCQKRVKANKRGTTCPYCHEKIHTACLEVHRGPCLTFQGERDAELRKLGGTK